QAEDGIRDGHVTGVQTCALPISELFARFSASDIPGVLALMTDDVTWRIPGKPELSPAAGIYDKERLGRLFRRMLAQLEGGLEMKIGRASCRERGWGRGRRGWIEE